MYRRLTIIAAALLGFALPAYAQQEPVRIIITKVDCSRLVRHTPSADVAYRPGEGMNGRKVTPADVPGSGAEAIPNLLPDVLEIPITVNPIAYGTRNKAYKDKAAAEQATAVNYAAKTAAQAAVTQLSSERTTLTATGATLTVQNATLVTEKATLAAQLAVMQAEVDAGTRSHLNPAYVSKTAEVAAKQTQIDAKQAQITANTASLAANASASATQQAIVDAAPGKDAQYAAAKAGAEATLARISSKGLDATTMAVGTVRYDIAKNSFTFNGEPLGGAEQHELAQACAKRGVR